MNDRLFNHESPIRGETFVTRKITRAASKIALVSYLGNLIQKYKEIFCDSLEAMCFNRFRTLYVTVNYFEIALFGSGFAWLGSI